MFKRFPSVALAFALGLALPAAAQAPQSVVTTSNLNMRSGPGTQHPVVAWVPKGTWIQAFGCTNPVTWCQTTFNGTHGWVSANHINPRPTIGTMPPPPPPPMPPPPPPPATGTWHPDIPLFGPGFRGEGDLCRRAGESAFTNQFLGGAGDLVACPPGTDPRLFAFETGGQEVGRRDGWILFTVPHGGAVVPPAQPPAPPPGINLFGPGYRNANDVCRRAGESDFTNRFLNPGADLVACPPGTDPNRFASDTGGREVARLEGWILFTVPQR